MSQNIHQIYIGNPITSNVGTDLMYFGQSPYGTSNDAAMLYSNFAAQLVPDLWVDQTTATATLINNTGYTTDAGASLVTYTLPATAKVGDWIEINGFSSGGWKVVYGTGQQIHVGASASTLTTGNIASTNQYDSIKLRCAVANTIWVTSSEIGNITVV